MCIKRLSAIFFVIVFFITAPSISSQTKNRVAVSEDDRIKLYEFNVSSQEFDLVWESAEITLNSHQGYRIQDIHISDIDGDDNYELIAIDPYGIYIWWNKGQFPRYFPFPEAALNPRFNFLSVVDINGDTRKELVIQRQNSDSTRRISVWRLDLNHLILQDKIDLPGYTSWSLRHGDFDGDGKNEILTSSELIHILGWKANEGLVIEAEIANAAWLVDVVRPADIDGDGIDEIIASGASGCFSVYKYRKIYDKPYYPLYFQSLIEPRESHSNSQGLHFADIVGDGRKEILVGMTSFPNYSKEDNILIYKCLPSSGQLGSALQFEKIFSMPHRVSNIPGFIIGDLDNDGDNEVIYNRKYVLKFTKDAEGKIKSRSLGELPIKYSRAVAIGPFHPSGENKPIEPHLNLISVRINLEEGRFIEPEKTYQIRVKLKSSWQDVSQIRVRLESDTDVAEITPNSVFFNTISQGQEGENSEQPFILKTKNVEKQTHFNLNLIIEAESGFRNEYLNIPLRTTNISRLYPFVQPRLKKILDTLAISSGEGRYSELGINLEYFNDNDGAFWPSLEDLNSYKNLIMYDEYSFALSITEHREKLKSFLAKGGNCLMQGYAFIAKLKAPTNPNMKDYADFVKSYLHVHDLDTTDKLTDLYGRSGDIITEGLKFDLKKGQEGLWPTVFEPFTSAIPILFYSDGQVAGVRIDGPYKMVILPFYLNDIESVEVRKTLLQRIMAWFDQE